MDAFTQKRVLRLRSEITSLQYENELYRSQRHHTLEEKHSDDLRRFRLLGSEAEEAIVEHIHEVAHNTGFDVEVEREVLEDAMYALEA